MKQRPSLIAALIAALIVLATGAASACTKDSECTAPNRCHFSTQATDGLCFDSSQMAVTQTVRGQSVPLKERKSGDVCQFDVDCAVAMNCFKRPGTAEGKCNTPPRQ